MREIFGTFSSKSLVFIALLVVVFFVSIFSGSNRDEWVVRSPDEKLSVKVELKDGKLTYSVAYANRPAMQHSPLGIVRGDGDFSADLHFVSKRENIVDEDYNLAVGKQLLCHNYAHQLYLTFENRNKEKIVLIFRAYNDGMAYRYHFPSANSEAFRIIEEKSGFAFGRDTKLWIQPYDMNVRKKPCYEAFYENGIALDGLAPSPAGWAFPVLVNTGGLWMLVTEADLDGAYPATHLNNRVGNTLTIRFPEKDEVTSDGGSEPVASLPWSTPWRAVVVGNSLSVIQETMLVTHLNPPSVVDDIFWVKPGRSSWSWWSAGATPKDFEVQKAYVDFTSEMGWEYVLIDSGWPQMKGGTMEELITYANSKNVGIVLWYHSGVGREKDTLSYANVMAFPAERKKEFEKIRRWGAKGVKVDFFDSDKQPVVQRYIDILKEAADHRIMVNFHGSTLPRGWERTYPHLVSMESVKGAEGAGRQEFCDRAPSHNTILPFTRNVVGSMDYTPVTFTNKRDAIRRTTFGHELALSVVFESGVFHFADNMKSYQALPDEPRQFLRQVPAAWDETRFIAGVPGRYAVVARRQGDKWYVAGINGQETSQELLLNLPFINDNKTFTLITDGDLPGSFASTNMIVSQRNNKLTIAPRGGFVLFEKR